MKFSNFILTMATLFTAGSAVAAGFDSRNNPVFTQGSTADLLISADLPSETSALQFTVTLPEAFEPGSENLALNSVVADKVQTRVHKENDNTYNYVLYTADNKPIDTSGDYLFGLSLTAKPTSVGGTYALRFSNIIAATPTGQETVLSEYSATLRLYIPVESITLSQSTAQLKVGESVALTATVLPDDATDKTVIWNSSNDAVATVDTDGKVTAVALGDAVITATCGDVSASCSVTVVPTPAASLTLSQSTAQLKVGESVALTATVLPDDATDKTVTWNSSNEVVATVDTNGKVTAVALGDAVITATCGDVSASCSVTVVPTPAASLTLSQSTAQLKVGESVALTATVLPDDATDKTVTWISSNEAVATVDADGKVTAVALGDAVITARCGDVSASCSVTVVPTQVESITISQSTAQLKVGETVTLTATVLPDDATDKTVIWNSSNEVVATVDTDGKVTAVALGDAVITATCGDVSASCSVTVVPTQVESITIRPNEWSGMEGDCIQLEVNVLPEDATDKSLSWSSSDKSVAEVDNGKVSILSEGTCIITATANDGSGIEAQCIITGLAGIDAIFSDSDTTMDVYGIGGILLKKDCDKDDLQQLAPGAYIVRQGQKTIKMIVK